MSFNTGGQQPSKQVWIQFLLQPETIPTDTTQLTLECSQAMLSAGILSEVKVVLSKV